MFDLNPLHTKQDPNDSAYVMCCTNNLFGTLDAYTRKALAQARRGIITYRFAMMALGRLRRQIARARTSNVGLE